MDNNELFRIYRKKTSAAHFTLIDKRVKQQIYKYVKSCKRKYVWGTKAMQKKLENLVQRWVKKFFTAEQLEKY